MPAGDRVGVKAGKPLTSTLKVYLLGRPVSMFVSLFSMTISERRVSESFTIFSMSFLFFFPCLSERGVSESFNVISVFFHV